VPIYRVHISAKRHDPLPPVAELTTVEADSPQEALEKLRQEPLAMSGGEVQTVWLKVVVSVWPSGEARHVLSTEVPVQRMDELN